MRTPIRIAAGAFLLFAILQLLLAGDEPLRAAVSTVLYWVFSSAAAILVGRAAKAARKGGDPDATTWMLLAAAQGAYVVGDTIWVVITIGLTS